MSRQATKAVGNRYYEARMRAAKYNEKLLTRAGAIEYLPGVTEDSLKKYELDITRPPNIVVALMADAYNEPELRSWYCVNECPLGKDCREIPEMPAERALIRLQNSVYEMEEVTKQLSLIMEDGAVSAGMGHAGGDSEKAPRVPPEGRRKPRRAGKGGKDREIRLREVRNGCGECCQGLPHREYPHTDS